MRRKRDGLHISSSADLEGLTHGGYDRSAPLSCDLQQMLGRWRWPAFEVGSVEDVDDDGW